jgi:cysteine desulfurase
MTGVTQRDVYLDNNGSTPVHPAVLEAFLASLRNTCGNASASHPLGQRAQVEIAVAKEQAAGALGAEPDEIWFTSGGTESNNWALKGCLDAARAAAGGPGHLVVSAIEHKSVLRSAEALARGGVALTVVPVGASGRVRVEDVERALRPDTRLVSLMLANNETGVLQPVREVAQLCRARGVRFHTDAVAAIGKVAIDVRELGCDLLSLSGHKLYAPKGCGVLYVKRGTALSPLIDGCGQQCGMRSGTENNPAVAALGKAFELLARGEFRAARSSELRDLLWERIHALDPKAVRNGEEPTLPNTLSVSFSQRTGAELLGELGRRGVHVAAGAAATGAAPSHVLMAMGHGETRARSTLRLTLGTSTTREDIEFAAKALASALAATAPTLFVPASPR